MFLPKVLNNLTTTKFVPIVEKTVTPYIDLIDKGEYKRYMELLATEKPFSKLSHKDNILLERAYGFHTYDSLRPVSVHHLFDLASITKVSAATLAIMKMYDDGLIHLDEPIKSYLKEFRLNKRGNATIRELMTHKSGWKSWIPYYQDMKKTDGTWKKKYIAGESDRKHETGLHANLYLFNKAPKYIYKRIRRAPYNPDQGFVYSDMFFYLVPMLVERLTGMNFENYLQENFYDPLGAETITYNPLYKYPDSLIVPTEIDTFFRNIRIHGVVHDEGAVMLKGISGHAGLFSNARDLSKVWQMLLHDGKHDTLQLINPHTVRLFTTTQFPNEDNRRALGFDKPLIDYDSIKSSVAKEVSINSFGHTGYTGTFVWVDPDHDLMFIFLCNRVYPTRNQRAIYELNVRPVLHSLFYQYVIEQEANNSTILPHTNLLKNE